MIPNTTPTPNELYNGEMKKMSDTELRVVLIVTRATFGWIMDEKTGMRKIEDWISHSQLIRKSGRTSRSVSTAVDNCVKNGWIETRSEQGKLLATAEERKLHGGKIFYRLGKIFLDKTTTNKFSTTIVNSANPHRNYFQKPSQKLRTTKETVTNTLGDLNYYERKNQEFRERYGKL